MLKKLKDYRIILIKDNSLQAKEIRFKNLLIPITLIFTTLFFLISFVLLSSDINEIITLKVISKHKQKNNKLNNIIAEQSDKIDTLLKEIENIYRMDENLRKLIKLPSINEDIRKLGVGGGENKDQFNEYQYLIPEGLNLEYINNKLEFLSRSVKLEQLSYSDIEPIIIDNKDALLSYPAIYPINKGQIKLSSRYGNRRDPFTRKVKFHEGDDFSTKVGIDVIATADGVIKTSKYYGSFGNYLEIDHGNGIVTVYGHLSKRLLKKGNSVQRGDIIGKVGNTGKSTAPHLHYEVRLHSEHVNPKNYYFN